jgi:hypothetical protein
VSVQSQSLLNWNQANVCCNVRGQRIPFWRNANLRLSLSLSTILLLHRILFRFFTRLRAHLLTPEARPFRQRNKRTSKTLTSSLAPAVGASLAGFMLAVYPKDQLRVTISIYALSRAAEFAYNLAEDEGWIWGKEGSGWERPWWWGSWLIFPFTSGQLLHTFVFDRDTFPKVWIECCGNELMLTCSGIRRIHIKILFPVHSAPAGGLSFQPPMAGQV